MAFVAGEFYILSSLFNMTLTSFLLMRISAGARNGDDSFRIRVSNNRISLIGPLKTKDLRPVLATMHNVVVNKGFKDIEIDFSACTSAFGPTMLPIAAYAERYLIDGIDVDLILPRDEPLNRLFLNANWAHFIDPRHYDLSSYRGYTQVPAQKFNSKEQQSDAVGRVMEKILAGLDGFDRNHLKAIEWSLNEITDNVLNHAQSPIGGLIQVTNSRRGSRAVEFAVCDVGVGIPRTLREGHREIHSDQEALDRAIREGVTRDTGVGQGNGLYGSWRISQLSGSSFQIQAGNASLVSWANSLHIYREDVPFNGSLVVVGINYEKPISLEQALRIDGRAHDPIDHVEIKYDETDETLVFPLAHESSGFGSRPAGVPVRQKLVNLSRISGGKKIIVDFSDVPIISSSFADEVFGKLFVHFGPLDFMKFFDFRRIDPTIRGLINKAIQQRAKTGL